MLMVEAEFRTVLNGLFQIWDRRRSGKYLTLKRPMAMRHVVNSLTHLFFVRF